MDDWCGDNHRSGWDELCVVIGRSMATGGKKIYAHYEGKHASKEITKILWVRVETEVEELLRSFVKEAGFAADPKSFAVLLSSGEVMETGAIYPKLEHKDDCLIQDIIINGSTLPAAKLSQGQTTPTLSEIETLIQNQQFRKARVLCEEFLKSTPSNFAVLEALTLVLFSSKHFQEAAMVGEKALQVEPRDISRRIYLILGQSLLENQDPEEAFHIFRRGVEVCEKRLTTSAEGKTLYLNLKAEVCRALFLLGRHPEAGSAINDLMTAPNPYGADPQTNVSSLLIYAEIAAQYDKVPSCHLTSPHSRQIPEALQAALKAVVAEQTNKRAKKLIAAILSHPTGLDELYRQVPPSPGASSAYAFLAMAIKDHSALGPAERLFRRVLEIERAKPLSAASLEIHNHVLNLVHLLETAAQPFAALSEIAAHLRVLLDTGVGGPLGLQEVLDEIDSAIALIAVSSQTRSPTLFFPPILSTGTPPVRVLWAQGLDASEESPHLVPVDADDLTTVMPLRRLQTAPPLDLLAILFTAMKILFVQGNLAAVTRLIEGVELLRQSFLEIHHTPLHSTSIRNEHAYYLCLCQVLSTIQQRPSSLPTFPYYESSYFNHNRPIFLCGDSHCLSAAWSLISVPCDLSDSQSPRQSRLLIPKLVTGLKQWHLRPNSDFYPKEGFQRMVAGLPEGADVSDCPSSSSPLLLQVILMVGEIDCREGLLVALERGLYSSLEEGIRETLKVFKATITHLVQKKRLRVRPLFSPSLTQTGVRPPGQPRVGCDSPDRDALQFPLPADGGRDHRSTPTPPPSSLAQVATGSTSSSRFWLRLPLIPRAWASVSNGSWTGHTSTPPTSPSSSAPFRASRVAFLTRTFLAADRAMRKREC
jgi:tetratricopeptide (TPR) repeat protein